MTREEAKQKALELFGPTAGVTDGLQMKESLEDAVGVGFHEGSELCIQGKGITWEAALAHAITRRAKWESRLVTRPKIEVERDADDPTMMHVTVNPAKPIEFIKQEFKVDLNEWRKAEEEARQFQERVQEKVRKKWGDT